MSTWWYGVLVLSGGCGGEPPAAAPSPSAASARPAPAKQVGQIDVDGLERELGQGRVPVLVDVRTPAERQRGSIPGSIGIPLSELQRRVAELEPHRDGPVYLVCQSGNRSQRAATWLAGRGFEVVNVQGGTGRWMARGYPMEKPAE